MMFYIKVISWVVVLVPIAIFAGGWFYAWKLSTSLFDKRGTDDEV